MFHGMPSCPTEETADPFYADDRNFYKLEKWTKDGTKVDRLLHAGNNWPRPKSYLRAPSSIDRA